MYDYREGAKITSLCAHCEKKVTSTLTNTTLSLCKGLEEVEGVLVRICNECGNIASIPHRSVEPIQLAMKKLVDSGAVSERGKIPVELKSFVVREKGFNRKSEPSHQEEYPLVVTE